MTALRESSLCADLRSEMARLKGVGLSLLPLGGGVDGKAPLLRTWAGADLSLSRILAPMHRTGSEVYGIRLDGLAVIDCDTDSADLVSQMEARFGPSPVHVRTPRGRHLYFRNGGEAPNLRAEGLPVDVKTGPRAYVVGPLSLRPDGGRYSPAKGLLGVDALPCLKAPLRPSPALLEAGRIETGERHNSLVMEALNMVEYVEGLEELTRNLEAVRDNWCADPATLPDAEVRGIASWAWKCRLDNRIYRGRDSAFRLDRQALDALRGLPNEGDALSLYITLMDKHGHIPGKRIVLDHVAMRAAGLTALSLGRFRAARRTLEAANLLKQVGNHRAGSVKQTFSLCRPRLQSTKSTAAPLFGPDRPKGAGKQGGGSRLTYVDAIAPHKSGVQHGH